LDKKLVTVGERIIDGILSALAMGVTAVVAPIGVVVLSRGRGLSMLGVFGTFHYWGISLIVIAGILGASLGANRVTTLFGHLWGTEEPQDIRMTLSLWIAVMGIGYASYWILGRHHVL
jgi:hypothetical protein